MSERGEGRFDRLWTMNLVTYWSAQLIITSIRIIGVRTYPVAVITPTLRKSTGE